MTRPRLQVVKNDEIVNAIQVIRKHRPGLINDSMVVTSALVEHALALEAQAARLIEVDRLTSQSTSDHD